MPKYDFNKIALLCNFIEITIRHGCSPANVQYIFRPPFLKNTSGRLLLNLRTFSEKHQKSSHRRFSIKKTVLKNTAKFTGKHLCQSLFFNKVAGVNLQLY